MYWPLESEPLTIDQRQPLGVHRVECRFEWSRLATLPRQVVTVHNPFDRHEGRVMRVHDRSALGCWPASPDTRKRSAMRQNSPEAISNVECALDAELGQVVREIAARCHHRALEWAAVGRRGDPAAEAAVAGAIEFDEHDHRVQPTRFFQRESQEWSGRSGRTDRALESRPPQTYFTSQSAW